MSFSCAKRRRNKLHSVGLGVSSKRYILFYNHDKYKGAAVAELIGKLVPRFCRKRLRNHILMSNRRVDGVPVCRVTTGINSIFRGPQARFFGISASDRVTFKVRGRTHPPGGLTRQMRRAARSLRVRGLQGEGVFRLSNKRGRGVTFTSICTVGPRVCLLSRPSSGLSVASVRRLGRRLQLVGGRNGAILVTRRHLCCLVRLTSQVICLRGKRVGKVCAPRRF